MLGSLRKLFAKKQEPVVRLADEEKDTIRRFARGETELREKAIAIFYRALRDGTWQSAMKEKESKTKTMLLFMSEVDAKVPDLMLRAKYREQVSKIS